MHQPDFFHILHHTSYFLHHRAHARCGAQCGQSRSQNANDDLNHRFPSLSFHHIFFIITFLHFYIFTFSKSCPEGQTLY